LDDDDPTTEELRLSALRREAAEKDLARKAPTEDAEEQHERRAEKTGYLREKLHERAESERQSDN
jgi:hypothetical protein